MLLRLLNFIGLVFSFAYPYGASQKLKKYRDILYTGWIRRRFKTLRGYVRYKIEIVGSQYISIGENTNIQERVRLYAWDTFHEQRFTPVINIGSDTIIQKDCFLSAVNKIEIGDRVAVTEHTMILDNIHGDFQDNHLSFTENSEVPDVFLQNAYTRPLSSKGPVIIEDDVHIGMFCTILPGTVIGHHSVIAAHSVVSRKIPPYSLVAGNPAEVIMTFGRKKRK